MFLSAGIFEVWRLWSLAFLIVETAAFVLPAYLPTVEQRIALLSSYAIVHAAGLQESWRRLKHRMTRPAR
jgi:hypothetical protein